MKIPVFWLEATDQNRRFLRRYSSGRKGHCPESGCHNARVEIERGPDVVVNGYSIAESPPMDDTRWPTQCSCGYVFAEDDHYQLFSEHIYRRSDTGGEETIRDASPGAMWDAWWLGRKGPDGISLMVKTPSGDWFVDGRASNCTMPEDNEHKCWVRHGNPKNPQGSEPLHVDKNGNTCGAGAGSIGQEAYHGFLHNGYLRAA